MPWGIAAGVVGSVAGSAISSAMSPSTSGGSGSGGGPSYYIPTGLSGADLAWQGLLRQQQISQNSINQASPLYGGMSLQDALAANQQYGGGYQNAANAAGAQYSNLGQQLQNAAGQQFGGAQNIYQTAFDPQNALYNRTVQQLQDQTGATNSMYGLGSSAAGAGVANQALSNFNIDWQNQQLQRQIQGLGAAGQAYGQAGALGQAGAGATLQGGQLPYSTGQYLAGVPGQLASTYANQIEQGPLSSASSISGQIIPYMNYGQGAQSIPYQNAGVNAQNMGQSIASGIGGLGSAVQNAGGWGNFFNGTTGSFGSGDFSGAFTSNPYYSGGGNQYGFTM